MSVNNPRFPHTCRIIRYTAATPLTDEANVLDPLTDEGDYADAVADGSVKVVYEGVCRGFNRDTTSGNGDVNTSYRMLALPIKQDEWTEETIPLEGDKVELQRFGYTEYGLVVDKRPGNLGTHIMWKYVRN